MLEPPSLLTEAVPWDSADAARWVDQRAPRWTQARWFGLALLAAAAAGVALSKDQPCTATAPCGPDWLGMVVIGVLFPLPYWSHRLPELLLLAAPALVGILAIGTVTGDNEDAPIANALLVAVLVFGWAGACRRLLARRRQRLAAEQAAADLRFTLPEGLGPLRRGLLPIAVGLLLIVMSSVLVVLALHAIDTDRQHEARATSAQAVVVKRYDQSLRVRTADGHQYTVPAALPEDYALAGTVPLVVDGDWSRLATERYDATGRQVGTLLLAIPGVSLLALGLLSRHRAAALRRGPVPVLRVRRRRRDNVDTVHAADDTGFDAPLFRYSAVPEKTGAPRPAQHEALLFGAPYEGGELVLLTRHGIERTVGPLRRPTGANLFGRRSDQTWRPSEADLAQAAEALSPSPEAMHWGPGPRTRIVGLLLTLVPVLVVSVVADDLSHRRFIHLLLLLSVPFLAAQAARTLNWHITADRAGLWLSGAWQVRRVPWAEVEGVSVSANGMIKVCLSENGRWSTSESVIFPKEHPPVASARAAATLLVLRDNPRLRPATNLDPRSRSVPLGPVLLVGCAALLAVLLAAWPAP